MNAFTSANPQRGNYWNVKQPPVPYVASQPSRVPIRTSLGWSGEQIPTDRPAFQAPPPLVVAASLAAVEGLVIGVVGLVELVNLSSGRLTMGLTTTVFFAAYAAGLLFCAWQVNRGTPWVRSPLVLAQLIQLGIAWNFRGTPAVAIALALVALVVLAGLFHPASMRALDRE